MVVEPVTVHHSVSRSACQVLHCVLLGRAECFGVAHMAMVLCPPQVAGSGNGFQWDGRREGWHTALRGRKGPMKAG